MLSRETIIEASSLRREQVDVPELGGVLVVTEMSTAERDRFATLEPSHPEARFDPGVRLVARSLVDDRGSTLLTLQEAEDLARRCPAGFDRLVRAAARINHVCTRDLALLAPRFGRAA